MNSKMTRCIGKKRRRVRPRQQQRQQKPGWRYLCFLVLCITLIASTTTAYLPTSSYFPSTRYTLRRSRNESWIRKKNLMPYLSFLTERKIDSSDVNDNTTLFLSRKDRISATETWNKRCISAVFATAFCIGTLFVGNNIENAMAATAPETVTRKTTTTTTRTRGHRYWSIIDSESNQNQKSNNDYDDDSIANDSASALQGLTPIFSKQDKIQVNEALIDYVVGTISTQYYDNSGGAWFNPSDFYHQWKDLQKGVDTLYKNNVETRFSTTDTSSSSFENGLTLRHRRGTNVDSIATAREHSNLNKVEYRHSAFPEEALHLDTREGTVQAIKWLVGSLRDPYSKYMTPEELRNEYHGSHDGFLGTGAWVEAPSISNDRRFPSYDATVTTSNTPSIFMSDYQRAKTTSHSRQRWLSSTRVANLPVITAITPNSPAERAGLVVGDRIVAVGDRDFFGLTRNGIAKTLRSHFNAESYFGNADLTIAKPVYAVSSPTSGASWGRNMVAAPQSPLLQSVSATAESPVFVSPREIVLGYRSIKLQLPTKTSQPPLLVWPQSSTLLGTTSANAFTRTSNGDTVVEYDLLTPSSGSIFDHSHSDDVIADDYKVGYIRLTRFSKLSTTGFFQAVQSLEEAGAQSYIIDLRNNYGGIIQEAMLTASTLLRDPHAVLCYTLNARGGFTPVEVGQYAVDPRYPGYLLSKESKIVTLQQIHKDHPEIFRTKRTSGKIEWDPPSSYASIHEQVAKRGIRRISNVNDQITMQQQNQNLYDHMLKQEMSKRKDIVILINEGTASSAEFFAAALHDNGRSVAVIGTKSFGKGLIQHTFPMPDGGGLKLTVGEFLRPSLQHVTNVFDARFDQESGEFVGGGIRPDVYCDSKQGIPGNPKADLCVGVALDVLEERAENRASFTTFGRR